MRLIFGNNFIVSGMLHKNRRLCTKCGKSTVYCKAGKVLVITVERVNVKMLITAFSFNLHQLRTLKRKGTI